MKSIFNIIIGVLVIIAAVRFIGFGFSEPEHRNVIPVTVKPAAKQITIVFAQDGSKSISEHGVELATSEVFNPYFACTDAHISLTYLLISSWSAQKPLNVELPAIPFSIPTMPDLRSMTITEKRDAKAQFKIAWDLYVADSVRFYAARNAAIRQFRASVDSLIGIYRNNLSDETDLVTSIELANKVLQTAQGKRYILINSDGLDSRNRTIANITSQAEVFLINGAGNTPTSIDALVSKTFADPMSAIVFTLQNQ
jgi:hypothetical protein